MYLIIFFFLVVFFCLIDEVKVDIFTQPTEEEIKARNPEVEKGGVWSPKDCQAWQKVAIIIPYRDRYRFLMILLNRLLPMLQRQQLSFRFFVIEQVSASVHFKSIVKWCGGGGGEKDFENRCFIHVCKEMFLHTLSHCF